MEVTSFQDHVPRAKAACARAVRAVLGERPPLDVTVALVDDREIARVHQEFLGVEGPTDVITFPYGEIVVSAETAAREAAARGHRPVHELQLYVVHGALHLKGYDDATPAERKRMRAAERRALSRLGLGDLFGARRA